MNRRSRKPFGAVWSAALFFALSAIGLRADGISVKPSADRLRMFEILTVQIGLPCPFANPFDPEDIRVDAVITAPDGKELVLPCFYKSGASGASQWEARFTPMQAGSHAYRIQVFRRGDVSNSRAYRLDVTDAKRAKRDGFLHLDPRTQYDFVFDSGRRFRGVGMNLGWEMQSEFRHPYEAYFDELEKNRANFFRTWMCTWNLPLEWTRVNQYETFVDELADWSKAFSHTPGLALVSGKYAFTEDDTNRVTIKSDSSQALVYHLNEIRRFKIKCFYRGRLSTEKIRCSYSRDNVSYNPIPIEFSQTWNTQDDWQRIFIAYIADLPDSSNYLKIEFLNGLEGSPHLGNVLIEYGRPTNILDAPGLGRYYAKTADRLDVLFRLAEQKGLYIMLTLDYHGVFKSYMDRWASNAEWRTNPYNADNGGPCRNPEDFFTNAEAKKFYKNRLRYLVARWGYSTHLACWEFWNEIDNVMEWQKVPAAAIAGWHEEMADFLKQIDPYGHLVSTSVSYREIPGLWEIKNLDFTQHHNYGPTANMKESILKYAERFKKPDVVGEFALGWKGPGKDYPVDLYEGELHDGIWRGLFSPTPVLPLTLWWEWHYAQRHYGHFKTASDFVQWMLKNQEQELQDCPVSCVEPQIETMGLRSGKQIFVWLKNLGTEGRNGCTLRMEGLESGKLRVVMVDTWTGLFSKEMEREVRDGVLFLDGISLKGGRDVALWIRP